MEDAFEEQLLLLVLLRRRRRRIKTTVLEPHQNSGFVAFSHMHAEPIWLPMTGKKTVVATDDRLCKGDFLQTM